MRDLTPSNSYNKHIPIGLDLRKEIETMFIEFGYDVLLHRRNTKIICHCVDRILFSPQKDCIYCNGTGYVSTIEKYTTVTTGEQGTVKLKNSQLISSDNNRFYFMHYVHPTQNDSIYIVRWNDAGIPIELVSEYNINGVYQKRADDGRIEFYTVDSSLNIVNRKIKSVNMRKVSSDIYGVSKNNLIVHYDLLFANRP